MSRVFLWVALMIFSFIVCAASNDKLRGTEAANSGRYAEAYRLWLPLAENGDREVQESLALLLSSGNDIGMKLSTPERDALVLKWLTKSAQNGQPSAMKWLADAFRHGWLGVPKNDAVSACWAKASGGAANASDCEGLIRSGNLALGQDISRVDEMSDKPVGDYLRNDYIERLNALYSAFRADIWNAPTLLVLEKRGAGLHVQTIINFHEGDASLEWMTGGQVRVLDDGTHVENVKLLADQPDSVRLAYGRQGLARYVFVGNAARYIGRALLVGRYVGSDGKSYEFGEHGVATFPDHAFKYEVGVDHVINHFDYFTDTESGRIFAFKRTKLGVDLYNTSGPLDQVMDGAPFVRLKRVE